MTHKFSTSAVWRVCLHAQSAMGKPRITRISSKDGVLSDNTNKHILRIDGKNGTGETEGE